MKRILLTTMVVLTTVLAPQSIKAQKIDQVSGQVVWKGTTLQNAVAPLDDNKFVYLIQFQSTLSQGSPEKYLSAGGAYGVQGKLSSVGMRVQIVSGEKNNSYQVVSRIYNGGNGTETYTGDRLGYHYGNNNDNGQAVYLDRNQASGNYNHVNWTITQTTVQKTGVKFEGEATAHTEDVTVITFKNADGGTQYSIGIDNNGLLVTTNGAATQWIIVTEEDFKTAMASVTWGEVDLGAFIKDAEFGRNNKDEIFWEWGTWNGNDWEKAADQKDSWTTTTGSQHWHQRTQNDMCNGQYLPDDKATIDNALIGANVTGTNQGTTNLGGLRNQYGQYYKAEIYNEAIALSQTLSSSNIPNLTEGLYKVSAQALYHDGAAGTTNNNVSFFVVKRVEYADASRTTVKDITVQRLPVLPINSLEGNNITVASGISAGYVMNTNANAYKLDFFLEITGTTDITIGIEQTEATGWTVIGNVHLFAHGKQAIFLDEDWCQGTCVPYKENGVDHWSQGNPYQHTQFSERYEYPATCYYNRTFTKGEFNPICLPIALTGNQVRQAFGNDCMLSEFAGLSQNQPSLMVFKLVNLDGDGKVTQPGVPYIVKVTTDPLVPVGEELTLEVGNGGQNHTVTLAGPIYTIPGVTKEETKDFADGLPSLQPVTKDGITFEGTYYFKGIPVADVSTEDYWLLRRGDLYHLDGSNPISLYEYVIPEGADHGSNVRTDKKGYMVWGTYAYLHAPKTTTPTGIDRRMTFGIEDEAGDITAIGTIDNLQFTIDASHSTLYTLQNAVYDLQGRMVSEVGNVNGEKLRRGVYVQNGKKFVVTK